VLFRPASFPARLQTAISNSLAISHPKHFHARQILPRSALVFCGPGIFNSPLAFFKDKSEEISENGSFALIRNHRYQLSGVSILGSECLTGGKNVIDYGIYRK
jgi:hypothetical protein